VNYIYVTFIIILLSYLYCIGLFLSYLIVIMVIMLTDNKMDHFLGTPFCAIFTC